MNKIRNSPNEWGFFVIIDKEKEERCCKKPRPSFIFIDESDKFKYYLKTRKYDPYRNVIFIKPKVIEPKKYRSSLTVIKKRFHSICAVVINILSSTGAFLFYANSMIKLRV